MNWDSQLNSILSAADGSVAKMRERLSSAGELSKGAEDEPRDLAFTGTFTKVVDPELFQFANVDGKSPTKNSDNKAAKNDVPQTVPSKQNQPILESAEDSDRSSEVDLCDAPVAEPSKNVPCMTGRIISPKKPASPASSDSRPNSGEEACLTSTKSLEAASSSSNCFPLFMGTAKNSSSQFPCHYCPKSGYQPAVKTCLVCGASTCKKHLRPHLESPVFQNHALVSPMEDISLWRCREHHEINRIYCRQCAACVCTVCTVIGSHRNHVCISIREAEKELRANLKEEIKQLQENIKERGFSSDLDPPALSHTAQPDHKSPSSLSSGVQWADLAAIQSQLQIQSKLIESLTQRLHDLEREKQSQQSHIQSLQEKVLNLHGELRAKSRERDDLGSGLERRMEQWMREVGRELSNLRGNLTEAASRGHLEESLSSKLRRDELEHLRRELDTLKTQIRRQEEDKHLQQTEAEETRRQYERSCKMLEELTGSYRTHSSDLMKTLCQFSDTQQVVYQMRKTLSELQKEVKSLNPRGHGSPPLVSALTAGDSLLPDPPRMSRRFRVDEEDSDSENFSPTPSLAEISSDDLSWLEEKDPAPRRRTPPSVLSTPSDFASPESDAEDDCGDLDDEDDNPGLESDLSLKDL